MHRTTSPTSISRSRSTPASISARVLLSILAILFPMQSPPAAIGQTAAPEVVTAKAQAEATIRVADALVGKAIATRNFDLLRRYWSPALIVNNPANLIVGREQIIDSMNHGGLNYTSIHAVPELFTLTNGIAVRMSHENLVMAAGPMAGKHLVRRATEIFERSGDDWLLIARQATYLGFDGAILAGFVPTTYTPPPPTAEITAIHAQIDANSQAVGRAIHTMDFASLAKFWSPALVVNSPGNRILTRDQVFTSMREDKLKYSSAKAYPDALLRHRQPRHLHGPRRHSSWRKVPWPANP